MKTLKDIKTRCDELNIQYAYGQFLTPTEPPHLVAIGGNSNNFSADNITYCKIQEIELVYTFIEKDEEYESLIENNLLSDICWRKTEEVFIPKERIWQVSYFFEI